MPVFDPASLDQFAAIVARMQDAQAGAQSPPPAQNGIGWGPYAALLGGEASDIATTKYAQSKGAVEGNPLMGSMGPAAIASKAGIAAALALVMRHLAQQGHPTLAKAIGYGSGAGLGAVAAHNVSVANKP